MWWKLRSGADDYITKPFSLAVLRARVNTQSRKTAAGETRICIDAFAFDFERMEYRKNGAEVTLSKTEQKLLRLLVENRGRVSSRADLVDRIWTDGAEYGTRMRCPSRSSVCATSWRKLPPSRSI